MDRERLTPPPTLQPLESGNRLGRFSDTVRSRESLTLLAQAVGIIVGAVGAFLMLAWAFTFVPFWLLIVATAALGGVVFVKSRKVEQRQWWIDQGCCAACGYDLRRLPTSVCPECGRDAAADEPPWRRLRREHDAKFGAKKAAPAGGGGGRLTEAQVRRLLAEAADRATDATG